MKQEIDVEEAIEQMSESAIMCRDISHSWRDHKAQRIRTGFYRVLLCRQCLAERHEELDRFGRLVSRSYHYQDGYQTKGLGRMNADMKSMLRLQSLLRAEKAGKVMAEAESE